jgi:dTMP kinase
MKQQRFFITFEGPEGGGKSTHSILLEKYLLSKGFDVVHTREPGGTSLAEKIRKILLDPENSISPLTELMLYEAARAQHVTDVIVPALEKKKIVICDRYTDATIAYQGYGRKIDIDTIRALNAIATFNIVPDLTILMDIPVEKGLIKAKSLNKETYISGDRLERESLEFHTKVRNGYLALAKNEPDRIKIIKMKDTHEETSSEIINVVNKALKI